MILSAVSPGAEPHVLSILPFVLLLGAIALAPQLNLHWWENHYPKVALGLGTMTVLYYLIGLRDAGSLWHSLVEYVSFLAIVGSLYVVAGGIHVGVKGEATPLRNTLFLAVGAVLASIIGTTGASMVLIRPWIRMNRYRVTAYHIVFFIFIVSNCGGCLTPIGDPPLFLGYLRGVPFFWVIEHCWPMWMVVNGLLLGIFFWMDRKNFLRAPEPVRERETAHETFQITGKQNLIFLILIIGAVFIQKPLFLREGIMLIVAFLSYVLTKREIHERNDFNFGPIKEVAILFLGIFATMIPALTYLERHAGSWGNASALTFYFATGGLSAFLDNAPTYLAFLSAATGILAQNGGPAIGSGQEIAFMIETQNHYLVSISLGAVFFGAMTYIGNGPNFMVKMIADQSKVETPGFLGYLFRYAVPILLPILVLIGWLSVVGVSH